MFRFSIREMMLVTLVASVLLAWRVDRRQLGNELAAAREEMLVAKGEANSSSYSLSLYKMDIKGIEQQLAHYGLALGYNPCGGYPYVCERPKGGTQKTLLPPKSPRP